MLVRDNLRELDGRDTLTSLCDDHDTKSVPVTVQKVSTKKLFCNSTSNSTNISTSRGLLRAMKFPRISPSTNGLTFLYHSCILPVQTS